MPLRRCGFPDHATHVACQIAACLRGLREAAGDESHYIGAWLNKELTALEGAE
jgi:hypothetical protein